MFEADDREQRPSPRCPPETDDSREDSTIKGSAEMTLHHTTDREPTRYIFLLLPDIRSYISPHSTSGTVRQLSKKIDGELSSRTSDLDVQFWSVVGSWVGLSQRVAFVRNCFVWDAPVATFSIFRRASMLSCSRGKSFAA